MYENMLFGIKFSVAHSTLRNIINNFKFNKILSSRYNTINILIEFYQ